jgi:hypothetical protein
MRGFKAQGSRALSLCPSPTPASMSAAFNFVRSALFDLHDGLQPAHFNSTDAETWLRKFSVALVCGGPTALRVLTYAC